MDNDILNYLFDRLRNGTLNQKEYQELVGFIRNQIKYYVTNKPLITDDKEEQIKDLISEIILSLTLSLKNSDKPIENPIGYLRTMISNLILKQELAYNGISQLRQHTKKILNQLEKQSKIISYNNRKFCINGFNKSIYDKESILNLISFYDFSEINQESRWTKRKFKLISDFIMTLLDEIKCIDFSTLIEFLKLKMELKYTNLNYDSGSLVNDEDSESIDNLNHLIYDQNSQENEQLLNEINQTYERLLYDFVTKNQKENLKILRIVYLYEFENKTLDEIAKIFNYSSPTTIQNILRKNSFLTPSEFVKSYSLLDEKITNPHEFLVRVNDLLLAKLKEVIDEFSDD